MEKELIQLKKFRTKEHAEEVLQVLTDANIEARLGDNLPVYDLTFTNSKVNDRYEILIKESDLDAAKDILDNIAREEIELIPKDYHLYSFDDDELKEVLIYHDEWNEIDVMLAEKILNDRGIKIDLSKIEDIRRDRIDEQRIQTPGNPWLIFGGYCLAVLGGIIGIGIGYHLWKSKKEVVPGEKILEFDEKTRYHGSVIFAIGVPMFILGILIKIFVLD